jgi:hypothetical protein
MHRLPPRHARASFCKSESNGHASQSGTALGWAPICICFNDAVGLESWLDQYGPFDALTFGASMLLTIPANLLDFYFPNDPSITGVAPRGASLDNLRKPWSIQEIYEAGEAAMMRLLRSGH